jgi:hypothetical protein
MSTARWAPAPPAFEHREISSREFSADETAFAEQMLRSPLAQARNPSCRGAARMARSIGRRATSP